MNQQKASVNPCPNPHVPPIKFEYRHLPVVNCFVQDIWGQWHRGDRAIHAYWAQATNMTKADQETYIGLLETNAFIVRRDAAEDPSKHPLYKDLAADPCWPKYVMLKAIYGQDTLSQKLLVNLEIDLEPVFGSLVIRDFTSAYNQYHLEKRKRDQESESEDNGNIPRRIAKKQSPEFEQTAVTTTPAQRPQDGAWTAAILRWTASALSASTARKLAMEEALRNQNAILKERCDALESSVADLKQKVDASHLNVVVLLTAILEKVGQSGDGIDVLRRGLGF
ncbi:hypothetical protein ACQKWADRAFT_328625 [Trichoderma austrokoningii]